MDQTYKADGGKSRPTLLEKDCVDALRAIQATLDYGAQKYSPRSWRMVEAERYDDAARRHRIAVDRGELRDAESNLLHRAHQIICELFQLQMDIEQLVAQDKDFDYTTFNTPPTDHKSEGRRLVGIPSDRNEPGSTRGDRIPVYDIPTFGIGRYADYSNNTLE